MHRDAAGWSIVQAPDVAGRHCSLERAGPRRLAVPVDESGTALTADFSAPLAGSPPWRVCLPDSPAAAATAVLTVEPGGGTHWTFLTNPRGGVG